MRCLIHEKSVLSAAVFIECERKQGFLLEVGKIINLFTFSLLTKLLTVLLRLQTYQSEDVNKTILDSLAFLLSHFIKYHFASFLQSEGASLRKKGGFGFLYRKFTEPLEWLCIMVRPSFSLWYMWASQLDPIPGMQWDTIRVRGVDSIKPALRPWEVSEISIAI